MPRPTIDYMQPTSNSVKDAEAEDVGHHAAKPDVAGGAGTDGSLSAAVTGSDTGFANKDSHWGYRRAVAGITPTLPLRKSLDNKT